MPLHNSPLPSLSFYPCTVFSVMFSHTCSRVLLVRRWAAQWRGPGSQQGRRKCQGDSWFWVFGRLLICIDHGITAYYIIWKLWNSEAKIIKMGISHKHFVYIISLPEVAWKKCKQKGLWFILVDIFRSEVTITVHWLINIIIDHS